MVNFISVGPKAEVDAEEQRRRALARRPFDVKKWLVRTRRHVVEFGNKRIEIRDGISNVIPTQQEILRFFHACDDVKVHVSDVHARGNVVSVIYLTRKKPVS